MSLFCPFSLRNLSVWKLWLLYNDQENMEYWPFYTCTRLITCLHIYIVINLTGRGPDWLTAARVNKILTKEESFAQGTWERIIFGKTLKHL